MFIPSFASRTDVCMLSYMSPLIHVGYASLSAHSFAAWFAALPIQTRSFAPRMPARATSSFDVSISTVCFSV